jgi:hypothetical protein
MVKDYGLQEIYFESLTGKIKMIGKNWPKQDIIDVVFILY